MLDRSTMQWLRGLGEATLAMTVLLVCLVCSPTHAQTLNLANFNGTGFDWTWAVSYTHLTLPTICSV